MKIKFGCEWGIAAIATIIILILIVVIIVFVVVPKENFSEEQPTISGPVGSVLAATGSNISMSGVPVDIDGIKVAIDDLILVTAQTNGIDNGIYKVRPGAWERSVIPNNTRVLGVSVLVRSGKTYGQTTWVTTNVPPDNLVGINNIKFAKQCKVQYESIGHGIALSRSAMDKYNDLIDANGDPVDYYLKENGSSKKINVSSKTLRNLVGFMPPSFALYPFGRRNKNYRSSKYEPDISTNFLGATKEETPSGTLEGNEKCKDYCTRTNCIALQLEVPENCMFGSKNTCGDLSNASCTMYYGSIQDADEAYYQLNQLDSSLVGRKYYEKTENPKATPMDGYSPNNSPVRWCQAYEQTPNSMTYESISKDAPCTCKSTDAICKDKNCCKVRKNLVTTMAVNAMKPIQTLPYNYLSGSYVTGKDLDTGGCCGKCKDASGKDIYVSCVGKKDKNWEVKLPDKCYDVFGGYNFDTEKMSDKDKDCYTTNSKDLTKLSDCSCFFQYNAIQLKETQQACGMGSSLTDDIKLDIGCIGGPPVLVSDYAFGTSSIIDILSGTPSTNGIYSCDSGEVKNMCEDDKPCLNGFPISCNDESPELFVPKRT